MGTKRTFRLSEPEIYLSYWYIGIYGLDCCDGRPFCTFAILDFLADSADSSGPDAIIGHERCPIAAPVNAEA